MVNKIKIGVLFFLLFSLMGCSESEYMNDVSSKIEMVTGMMEEAETDVTTDAEDIELFGAYAVDRVVDGDTIIVIIDNEEVRVRMIGVDTPESVHSDDSKNTDEGKIASEYTANLLTGEEVYIEYDEDMYDDYDRTLAYVYLSDGETMVNQVLIEQGLATTMTIQPNTKYADVFAECQEAACEDGVGFWKTEFFTN